MYRDRHPRGAYPPVRRPGFGRPAGSALLIALLILGALSMIATSLILISISERRSAGYYRESLQALAAAETGLSFAKRGIQDMTVEMDDADSDGRPDFAGSDTLSWGGTYQLIAEASDVAGTGIAAYRANGYTIVVEGTHNGAVRRVRAQIVHDSFLKYARFIAVTGTSYACGAILTGEVYSGGDLDVPSDCEGDAVEFLEFVAAVGDIPNAGYATFYRGYVTGASPIDLGNSVDFDAVRSRARGLLSECDCEGLGEVGIYTKRSVGIDPLALGTGPLNLSLFDFHNTTLASPDTVITYNGNAVVNTLTSQALRASDFNGLIFFDGDGPVKGTLDGRSGRSLSVYATGNVYVHGNIISGHTGYDESTGLPNSSGDPVNLGLIAYNYVYMHKNTPRVLQVDAALMASHANWQALGAVSDHPAAGPGPLDLDMDGISGETPYNNDPSPGLGWDEMNITSDTWVLNINGPIITYNGGSAGPWVDSGVLANADGPTRRYNYDMDITAYPPPCFPVPLNLWKDVSWTEVFDAESDLASHLPD